ncbi:hypothetical protein [Streptomyces sp. NPDC054887]
MRRASERAQERARSRTGRGAASRARRPEAAGEQPAAPEVEALLAAVRRSSPASGEVAGVRAALAAYREARDSGLLASPGRRRWGARGRDDWRPSRRRRGTLPVRAAFASLAATVTLGGVALAAGAGALPTPFGIGSGGPGAVATAPGDGARVPAGTGRGDDAGAAERDAARTPPAGVTPSWAALAARDEVAYCVAYLVPRGRSVAGPGAVPERLAAAAADADRTVEAYCEDLLEAGERRPDAGGEGSAAEPDDAGASGGTKAPQPGTAPGAPKTPAGPEGGAAARPDGADGGGAAAGDGRPGGEEDERGGSGDDGARADGGSGDGTGDKDPNDSGPR